MEADPYKGSADDPFDGDTFLCVHLKDPDATGVRPAITRLGVSIVVFLASRLAGLPGIVSQQSVHKSVHKWVTF